MTTLSPLTSMLLKFWLVLDNSSHLFHGLHFHPSELQLGYGPNMTVSHLVHWKWLLCFYLSVNFVPSEDFNLLKESEPIPAYFLLKNDYRSILVSPNALMIMFVKISIWEKTDDASYDYHMKAFLMNLFLSFKQVCVFHIMILFSSC